MNIDFNKSFASHEKSKYWSTKNIINPCDVLKNSNKKFLFNCLCGHEIEKQLSSIIRGEWCSFCSNPSSKLCKDENCIDCFEKSFASHEKSKYWSTKNNISPREVFKSSSKSYLFNCICGHEIEKKLYAITNGEWCMYCSNKELCKDENCIDCFEKSFASHEKSSFFSITNNINPRFLFKNSHQTYLFSCICNHNFNSQLISITRGRWCPYCSNPSSKLCKDDNCNDCFEKSFASHEKSKYWSNKNNISPREVFKKSDNKYLFDCICGHEFESSLYNISNNSWCPYCSNPPQKMCFSNECINCFEKSFASHEKSINWSKKNIINPREVFKNSHNKFFFYCNNGHEFECILSNISNGSGCYYCKNKTERKLFEILKKDFPEIKYQFKKDWCKNLTTNRKLPYDFALEKLNIIIELDGRQHFNQVSNWISPDKQYERDMYKMTCANNNGYSIIRITQEDVYNDTFNWYKILKESIELIKNKKSIENHFISYNNNYKNYLN